MPVRSFIRLQPGAVTARSLCPSSDTREGPLLPKERVERDEEDLVRLYLTDIGQYPLLTKDDEVRLAQAIEAGNEARRELEAGGKELTAARKRELRRHTRDGEDAERTFVQSNLRLVVSIAKKYQASGLPLLDLIQEGNLGLMHAVEKFDWRKGFKFSTYATWWIRQAITRGIANTGRTIRLPVHPGDTLARLQKARARLELKLYAVRRRLPSSRAHPRRPGSRHVSSPCGRTNARRNAACRAGVSGWRRASRSWASRASSVRLVCSRPPATSVRYLKCSGPSWLSPTKPARDDCQDGWPAIPASMNALVS